MESFFGAVRRRTLICYRNIQISASSITRDRIRSTTILPMSLQRSLIAHDHRPILDRLPSRIRFATGTGFGAEVRDAMDARVGHLVEHGLARRQGQRVVFARDLLATLRRRE